MSVWETLVGQERAVEQLRAAAEATHAQTGGMTHAWLITGPPGSGRSMAALAFAAALQCPAGGCGQCLDCRQALRGTHADVELVRTETVTMSVESTRELVRRAQLAPMRGRWHVIVVEDADRMNERANNALLKAIEEPPPGTVWLLCAPSVDDVWPTVRSRSRHVVLGTPTTAAVAQVLIDRDGVDPAMAWFAARASQGHIGRAKRLATDEQARLRRAEVLRLPASVGGVRDALVAAANLVDAAKEEGEAATKRLDAEERAEFERASGLAGETDRRAVRAMAAALRDLEDRQKKRATRAWRDALDRALIDLAAFYRDVLVTQLGAGVELVTDDLRAQVRETATRSGPEQTLRRIDAVLACRAAVAANVTPLLAVEAMALALRAPGGESAIPVRSMTERG